MSIPRKFTVRSAKGRSARAADLPARRGFLVGGVLLAPVGSAGALFLFPEGRVGLQIVHQEFARFERGAAMGRGHAYEHDTIARSQQPHAMDDRDAKER